MTQVAPDPKPTASLQATVRAARAKAQKAETVDLEIPGYDGTLWATFRALDDYKEANAINRRHEHVRDEDERDLEMGADVLITACVDTFVPEPGFQPGQPEHRHSLGLKLGEELAKWLAVAPTNGEGEPVGLSDIQAVFCIYPNTLKLAEAAAAVNMLTFNAGKAADRKTEGN